MFCIRMSYSLPKFSVWDFSRLPAVFSSPFKALNTRTSPVSSDRAQWLVLGAAFLGWMFDGLEMGIFPLVARPALQTMIHGSNGLGPDQFVGTWMGRITALFLVGAACGGFVFGWLG